MRIRTASGGVLILICFATFLLMCLGLLSYNALMATGAQSHQSKALNAAALTAAFDLGRIVVNDHNLGYIGLLDRAPIGGSLVARDNFAMPVRGINSLLGTARFDMIIADAIKSETVKKFAEEDYQNILNATTALTVAMNASIGPGGNKPTDANGIPVDAYGDALTVYLANGGIVSDKTGFSLTLGWSSGLSSSVSIPQPTQYAHINQSENLSGSYAAFTNLPYDNLNFVFAALDGQKPSLVTVERFLTGQGNLPFVVSDVVKAEGTETDKLLGVFSLPSAVTIHGISYAIPGGPSTRAMTPDAFAVSFPDGNLPELVAFQGLFVDPAISSVTMMSGQVSGGDYPIDQGSSVSSPAKTVPTWLATNPTLSECCEMAYYDWLRRAGCNARADSLVNMMKLPLSPLPNTKSPFMNVFTIGSDGNVSSNFLQLEQHYCQSSDSQPYCQPQGWLTKSNTYSQTIESPSRGQVYSVMVQDNVRQPGIIKGGKHGGEPIVDERLTQNPSFPDLSYTNTPNQFTGTPYPGPYTPVSNADGWGGKAGGWAFGIWLYTLQQVFYGWQPDWCQGGDNTPEKLVPQPTAQTIGAQRPTYNSPGLSVEIAFHEVINCLCEKNGDNPPPPPYYGVP